MRPSGAKRKPARLPEVWETFLDHGMDLEKFYHDLDRHIEQCAFVLPEPSLIFHVFEYVKPEDVRCVLFGEDPYPRATSACGVAFWDLEITDWSKKGNGNSLRNILKALLIQKGWADYTTPAQECRRIAVEKQVKSPPHLFRSWLSQGVFLVNTALTFSGTRDKKKHFQFWRPFHRNLIKQLNDRHESPCYVLWGRKAQSWIPAILESIDDPNKIIRQSHPTFIHQFLDPHHVHFSPFDELMEKTDIQWLELA